jgi:hypothetical protein
VTTETPARTAHTNYFTTDYLDYHTGFGTARRSPLPPTRGREPRASHVLHYSGIKSACLSERSLRLYRDSLEALGARSCLAIFAPARLRRRCRRLQSGNWYHCIRRCKSCTYTPPLSPQQCRNLYSESFRHSRHRSRLRRRYRHLQSGNWYHCIRRRMRCTYTPPLSPQQCRNLCSESFRHSRPCSRLRRRYRRLQSGNWYHCIRRRMRCTYTPPLFPQQCRN